MPFNAQMTFSLLAHETSNGDLSRTLRATPASYAVAIGDGTGAAQAQLAWSDARTMAGASETLNLAALADTRDGASVTATITAPKVIYIKNTGASPLTFSGGPLTGSGVVLAVGGFCVLADTSATGMAAGTITVAGAAAATYEIVIVGEGSIS